MKDCNCGVCGCQRQPIALYQDYDVITGAERARKQFRENTTAYIVRNYGTSAIRFNGAVIIPAGGADGYDSPLERGVITGQYDIESLTPGVDLNVTVQYIIKKSESCLSS